MPGNQKKVVVPEWLNEILDEDVDLMADRGSAGRSPLIGIWHVALGMYLELSQEERVGMARDLRIENATKESVERIKASLWPHRLLRSAASLSSRERDSLIQCLNMNPDFIALMMEQYRKRIEKAAATVVDESPQSTPPKSTSSRTSRKPKRGRPPRK